jgi:hypothetical protein
MQCSIDKQANDHISKLNANFMLHTHIYTATNGYLIYLQAV